MVNMNGVIVQNERMEGFNAHNAIKIQTSELANGVYQVIVRQGDYQEIKKISVIDCM